jgi:hypothetical protein
MSSFNSLFFFLGSSGTSRYEGLLSGVYRVTDTDLDRYELFIGDGTGPDLDSTPDATSPTLPFTHPIATEGDFRLVTVRRNKYGLRTLVGQETRLIIASGGVEVLADPSPPQNVTLTSVSGGRIRIRADYFYASDPEAARADKWIVFAKAGSDPDPDVDTAIVSSDHTRTNYLEQLDATSDGFADGQVIHVLVGVRRTGDGVQSFAAVVQQTADADQAGVIEDGGFAGDRHRQE